MIFRFFSSSKQQTAAEKLYVAILAQSRLPAFITEIGIADTVTGRFDILALHMMLFSRRLSNEADAAALPLSQAVFDIFTSDLDDALRVLGIGDTSVPKRKQALVRGFYAQVDELAPLIDDASDVALAQKLAARFSLGPDSAAILARYTRNAAGSLANTPLDAIFRGELKWPPLSKDVGNGQ